MVSQTDLTWNRALEWVQEIERLRDALGPGPGQPQDGPEAAPDDTPGDPNHE